MTVVLIIILLLYLLFLLVDTLKITLWKNYTIYLDLFKRYTINNKDIAIMFTIVRLLLVIGMVLSLYYKNIIIFLVIVTLHALNNEIFKNKI